MDYVMLDKAGINLEKLQKFSRRQVVTKSYRNEDGCWVLKEDAHVIDWDMVDIQFLVGCLLNTLDQGGIVLGALEGGEVLGFCSLEGAVFDQSNRYMQISSLHVTSGHRNKGIGKELFLLACQKAYANGAKKLYIAAQPSFETQEFYRKMGCRPAEVIYRSLPGNNPEDIQLEFLLGPFPEAGIYQV